MPLELGARLIAAGLVVPDEVEAALFLSVLRGISFARALIDRGAITERDLNEELDKRGDPPAISVEVDLMLFEALPEGLCSRLAVVPLGRDDESGTVDAAAVDPLDPHIAMELAFHLSSPIRVLRASLTSIEDALRRAELGAPSAGRRSSRLQRATLASPFGAPDSVGSYPASVPLPLTRKIEDHDTLIPSGEISPLSEEEEDTIRPLPSLPHPISEPATEPEPVLPLLPAKIIPSKIPPPMPPAEAAALENEGPPWVETMGPTTKPSSMMSAPASTRGGALSLGVPSQRGRSFGVSGGMDAPPSSRGPGSFRAAPVSSRRAPVYLTPPPDAPISFPTPPPPSNDEDVISVKDDEIISLEEVSDADLVSVREVPPPARESAPEVSLKARPPTLRSPILLPAQPPVGDEGRISDLPTGPWAAKQVLATAPDSAPTMALQSPEEEEPDSAPTIVRYSHELSDSDTTMAVSSPSPGGRAWPALRAPAAGMPPPPVPSAAMPSPLPARPPPGGKGPAIRGIPAAPSGPDSAPTMAISLPESSLVVTPPMQAPVSSAPSAPGPLRGAIPAPGAASLGLKDAIGEPQVAQMTLRNPPPAAGDAGMSAGTAASPEKEARVSPEEAVLGPVAANAVQDRPPESSPTLAFNANGPELPAAVPVLGAPPPESSPTLMGLGSGLRELVQPLQPAEAPPSPTAPVAPEPPVAAPVPVSAPVSAAVPRPSTPPPASLAHRPSSPPGAPARRPSMPPSLGFPSLRGSIPPPAGPPADLSLYPPEAARVLAALREAKTRDEAIELALQGITSVARRAAVFAVRKDSFRGWACTPSFGDQAAFREVVLPHDQPSLLAIAAGQPVYLGPLTPLPAHAPLAAIMGLASDDVAAVAARVSGRPALILFADDLNDTLVATRWMEELARGVGEALARMIGHRG